ncbi:helix-turn-helix domain-containing protein [Streptomyces sp. NPDC086783]
MPATADETRCSPKTVRRWLHRFNRLGLEGSEDLGIERWGPRSGPSPGRA